MSANLRRVLVIDDELGPRESLRMLLKERYDVVTAASVEEGLRLLREKCPDAVIMDIRMPGRNGIDGLRDIRKIDAFVSVVMLTGYATLETAQEALRLGANDYLKKPFETAEMIRVVDENVQRTIVERRRAVAMRDLGELNVRLTAELAKKEHMAALGQVSSEFAHDIRSPLTVIQGYVNILSKQLEGSRTAMGASATEMSRCLEIIEKNARRCSEMVETWQSLNRRDPKRLKVTAISEVLKEIVRSCAAGAEQNGAALSLEIATESSDVLADGIQIFRAIQNVVNNALQALSGPGGSVRVRCARVRDQIEIRVADTGCGIPPDNLRRLFEPYHTTKGDRQGMGLGLFITKKVVQDHGGSISVESQVGKGTTVTILLPCADSHQYPTAASAAAAAVGSVLLSAMVR